MREEILSWLESVQLTGQHLWEMVCHVQGIVKDRRGKLYWRYVYEYVPSHFNISLYAWPSFFHAVSAGWVSLGAEKGETSWMIYDVRVDRPQYRQRGIGTALVRAAIDLARHRGGSRLQGFVMGDDAKQHPFLPEWYARLGFTVQRSTRGDSIATFWMDLQAPQRTRA